MSFQFFAREVRETAALKLGDEAGWPKTPFERRLGPSQGVMAFGQFVDLMKSESRLTTVSGSREMRKEDAQIGKRAGRPRSPPLATGDKGSAEVSDLSYRGYCSRGRRPRRFGRKKTL